MKTLTIVPIILLLALSSQSHAGFNFMRDTGLEKARQIIDPGHYKKKARRQLEQAKRQIEAEKKAAIDQVIRDFNQDITQLKVDLNKATEDLERQMLIAQIQMLEKMKRAAIRALKKIS